METGEVQGVVQMQVQGSGEGVEVQGSAGEGGGEGVALMGRASHAAEGPRRR